MKNSRFLLLLSVLTILSYSVSAQFLKSGLIKKSYPTYSISVANKSKATEQVLALWDFENATKRANITDNISFISDPYTADDGIDANKDIATIQLIGGPVFVSWVTGTGGSGTFAANSNTWTNDANDRYWMITVSTEGYNNINISSKQQGSGTGPKDFQIEYSIDGSTWTSIGNPIVVQNNFTSGVVVNLSLPLECADQSNLCIRWLNTSLTSVNNGTTGATGTDRIDDIIVKGKAIGYDPATISPITAEYDLTYPDNVVVTINWNDASSIVSIVDNQDIPYELITEAVAPQTDDYIVLVNNLIITNEYLSQVLTNEGDEIVLIITFDFGDVALTISAIESELPIIHDVIAAWNFDNADKRAAIEDNDDFIEYPYTADEGIDANKDIAIIELFGAVEFISWVNGANGGGSKAPNTYHWHFIENERYWQTTISSKGYKDITVSSKQMGSNTGPKDFQIEYSINGVDWTAVGDPYVVLNDNFVSGTIENLALPEQCNHQANLKIRWRNISSTSIEGQTVAHGGTSRIDNIVITGVQIPIAELDGEINPTSAIFNLDEPTNIATSITWYGASQIINITDNQDEPYELINNADYEVDGDNLIINIAYLEEVLTNDGDEIELTITFDQGVATFKIFAISSTYIAETLNIINIYPNPSNGNFTIKSNDEAILKIIDASGRIVLVQNLQIGENNINLMNCDSGIYFVYISDDGRNTSFRLIVE